MCLTQGPPDMLMWIQHHVWLLLPPPGMDCASSSHYHTLCCPCRT
jgi:hypothetical protein